MKKVAVMNYKGGVGKTTVTANLAALYAYGLQKKVLVIDIDPQSNLTFSLVRPREDWAKVYLAQEKTLYSWFKKYRSGDIIGLKDIVVTPTNINKLIEKNERNGRLDLICSHLQLLSTENQLVLTIGDVTTDEGKYNFVEMHLRLKRALEQLENESDYDFVFIDCPPNFNTITRMALAACDHVLIPTRPDYLSATIGVPFLCNNIQNQLVGIFNRFINDLQDEDLKIHQVNPDILGVIFTMVQLRNGQPIAAEKGIIDHVREGEFRAFGLSKPLHIFNNYLLHNSSIFSDNDDYIPNILGRQTESNKKVKEQFRGFVIEFDKRLSNKS